MLISRTSTGICTPHGELRMQACRINSRSCMLVATEAQGRIMLLTSRIHLNEHLSKHRVRRLERRRLDELDRLDEWCADGRLHRVRGAIRHARRSIRRALVSQRAARGAARAALRAVHRAAVVRAVTPHAASRTVRAQTAVRTLRTDDQLDEADEGTHRQEQDEGETHAGRRWTVKSTSAGESERCT